MLAFADPAKPYLLHKDASFKVVGAVLYQEHPEGLRPVHQLEFFVLNCAVVNKFHDYLYGAKFMVRTDNNPLTYMLTTTKLNATGHRWLAALATYDFDVQYRSGKANVDADVLSRNIADLEDDGDWANVSPTAVKSICQQVQVRESPDESPRYVEQLGASPACIPVAYAFPSQLQSSSLEQFSKADLIKAQRKDEVLEQVIKAVTHGDWPSSKDISPDVLLFKREAGRLEMKGTSMSGWHEIQC